MQPAARAHLDACQANGLSVLVTCTWRSNAEQADLYAVGRTVPGKRCSCGGKLNELGTCDKHRMGLRVTNAKPGESMHNKTLGELPASLAYDLVVLRYGKPVWTTGGDGMDNDTSDDDTDDLELWQRVGVLGEAAGLEWAGRWIKFKEFPHFQWRHEV